MTVADITPPQFPARRQHVARQAHIAYVQARVPRAKSSGMREDKHVFELTTEENSGMNLKKIDNRKFRRKALRGSLREMFSRKNISTKWV